MSRIPVGRCFLTQVITAVVLIIAVDVLLFGASPGYGLSVLLVLGVLALALRLQGIRNRSRFLVIAILNALAAAAAVAVTGNVLAVAWGAVALLCLSALIRSNTALPPSRILTAVVLSSIEALVQPVQDALVLRRLRRHGRRQGVALAFLLGWILPMVLGGIFLTLFAIANPLVEQWCGRLWDWLSQAGFPGWDRIGLWMLGGGASWLLMRSRWRVTPGSPPGVAPVRDDTRLAVRCLLVFNLVFLVHNLLDITYLWGGARLPQGMTYAGYAHRGAHVLVLTALLAAGFVLAWFRPGAPIERSRTAGVLVLLWLGQNVVLLAGSALRLQQYVASYGLTRFRLAAAVWMLLVACGILLLGWRILSGKGNAWLINANLVTVAITLALCAMFDADRFIAWRNVLTLDRISLTRDPIDLDYLISLGPSALPALSWYAGNTRDPHQARCALTGVISLRAALVAENADWRSRTWDLWRARRLAVPVGDTRDVSRR
jgi:hypothetical protein